MLSLAEIAEREVNNKGIILFDSSVIGLEDFLELIFDAKKYADLDKRLLEDKLKVTGEFLDFVLQEHTFTVEDTLKNFKNLRNAVSNKQRYLNQRQKEMHQYTMYRKYIEMGESKRSLFERLSNEIFQIYKLIKSDKIFKPCNIKIYSTLYEEIPQLLGITPESAQLGHKHHELYATALYLSMQNPVALLVESVNFLERLELLAKSFSLKKQKIFPTLYSNQFPIKLYFDNGKKGYEIIYTSQK